MAELHRLVITNELKFNRFENAEETESLPVDYDAASDILRIHIGERPTETVVHYIDEYLGLLYDADTIEVTGVQIEAFQYSYVPTHGLSHTWDLSDAEQSGLKSTADVVETSERKKRAVASKVIRPVIQAHKNHQLVPA